MNEKEKILVYKTTKILEKDTSRMKLNDIIEELIQVIETNTMDLRLAFKSTLVEEI
ncbi:hypothetical protein [Gottfriedia acidiceleris]|uniref:hypothetical protein n=1 Tax=Gottfriedia acidiceleris TaxID=371036 RepID=UPI003D237217